MKYRVQVNEKTEQIEVWDAEDVDNMHWRRPTPEEMIPAIETVVVDLYLRIRRLGGA